ncbi:MAG TPA: DNA-deoxyinosine glycosylase [Steroidobacteraceae bacterium]|nr:DNA-deoxyinosine glycosylase [Steroidobacteraceae bacterium]
MKPQRAASPAPARARSFPPIVRPDARILILGSMPGTASLAAGQYYAHPHNQFWRLLGEICGAGIELPYARRLERLQQQRLALWDVLDSCVREGSLDSAIEHHSAVPNDIASLLRAAPGIRRLCCNGATAYHGVRRYFGSELDAQGITVIRLPSSSPANASWSFARKLAAWRGALAQEETASGVSAASAAGA